MTTRDHERVKAIRELHLEALRQAHVNALLRAVIQRIRNSTPQFGDAELIDDLESILRERE